jgi:dethiobiotin synthetase
MTARRVYIVGTDTGVGKTAVTCALLHWARRHRLRAMPFKPAASGLPAEPADTTNPSDVTRLLLAAGLCADTPICPWSFAAPLAPGLAEDPAPFFRPPAANADPIPDPIARTCEHLAALERELDPQLVFVEGAGGLHVPMPGGTWQPAWIRALATDVVVVGRAGLGTINHTLLTLDALRAHELPAVGFLLSDPTGGDDPSREHNPQVIATARGSRYLGTLTHQRAGDGGGTTDLLTPLLDALPD